MLCGRFRLAIFGRHSIKNIDQAPVAKLPCSLGKLLLNYTTACSIHVQFVMSKEPKYNMTESVFHSPPVYQDCEELKEVGRKYRDYGEEEENRKRENRP